MPKRRANGEGNIRKRKDGRWEGRYTVGHDPETGKAIIKNVLGKTQAEVKEKLKKAIEENIGIDYGRAKNYTVGNWLEVWYENYAKIKMRPSTYLTYHGYIENHIKPQLGGIPLAELTSLDLQQFYKHLLDGGRVDRIEAKKKPEGLAPKTVRNIHQMICSAYNLAMEQRLVTKNPTQGCALPKVEHKEMKNVDRRPTQRLLPRSQGQRRVRALLPRPRHGIAAGRTTGAEMGRRRPRPWCAENPTGNFTAERQGSGSPAENEKRLPHTAAVGRCDKRTENAEMQSRK